MRRTLSFFVPLVGGLVAIRGLWGNTEHFVAATVVVVLVFVILVVVAVRAYRRFVRRSLEHTLFVLDEGLLFKEGEIELKVPFGAIQELAIKRRGSTVLGIALKYDGHREILPGYEDIQLLAQLLQQRVQPERVSTFSWFHV
jgi:hypothetical protein